MGEIERKIVCVYIGDRQPSRGKERITRFGSVFVCVIRGNIVLGRSRFCLCFKSIRHSSGLAKEIVFICQMLIRNVWGVYIERENSLDVKETLFNS